MTSPTSTPEAQDASSCHPPLLPTSTRPTPPPMVNTPILTFVIALFGGMLGGGGLMIVDRYTHPTTQTIAASSSTDLPWVSPENIADPTLPVIADRHPTAEIASPKEAAAPLSTSVDGRLALAFFDVMQTVRSGQPFAVSLTRFTALADANPILLSSIRDQLSELRLLSEQGVPTPKNLIEKLENIPLPNPQPASDPDQTSWSQWIRDRLHGLIRITKVPNPDDTAQTAQSATQRRQPLIRALSNADANQADEKFASLSPQEQKDLSAWKDDFDRWKTTERHLNTLLHALLVPPIDVPPPAAEATP